MTLRLGMLLCLSGLAACSHDTPRTAENYEYVPPPSDASAEPGMQPASLEDSTSRDSAARPSTLPGGDTKGTGSNDYRADPTPVQPKATDPANPSTPPDNTKVNKRDRDSAAPTPLDQGNNETDLKITQQIRQAVMADSSLSFTAKNVKIITQGGKVTLRGPVNTAQERSAIEAAARKVAGATQLDNQLEVKK